MKHEIKQYLKQLEEYIGKKAFITSQLPKSLRNHRYIYSGYHAGIVYSLGKVWDSTMNYMVNVWSFNPYARKDIGFEKKRGYKSLAWVEAIKPVVQDKPFIYLTLPPEHQNSGAMKAASRLGLIEWVKDVCYLGQMRRQWRLV